MQVPMLKNSSNKASASFTMAFIAFNLVALWMLLSIVAPFFGVTTVPNFDGISAMAYLGPILTLYFGRRYMEAKEE